MSDLTNGTIEEMLRDIREALQMDVAFVSQFSEDQLLFRAIEGDAESFGWQEGESFPIDESYCKRVLDGRIPQMVPDAKREDATKDLRVTSEADMGCYCAVPLVLSDGRLYGTLCCVSHEPDPWLTAICDDTDPCKSWIHDACAAVLSRCSASLMRYGSTTLQPAVERFARQQASGV